MKAKKLISAFLILMVITATVFVPSTAYGAEGGGEYKTVKNVPSDSSAEFVTYDTAKFSNDYIKTPNTDIEFFVNATTWEAYRVPSDHGNAGDLTADMLKDVFGITADYSNGFNYTYAAGKLSIYKDCGLTEGENLAVTTQLVNDEFKYMADSRGNNLKAVVDAYLPGKDCSVDKLKYTYTSDGVLTLTQEMTVADTRYTSVNIGDSLSTYSTAINTLFGTLGAQYNTTNATFVDYNTIVSVINDTTYAYTHSDDEVAAAAAIKSLLDSAQLTGKADTGSMSDVKFSLVSLTGDNAIKISYTGTTQATKPFPDATASTSAKYKYTAVAEEKNVSGGFTAGTIPKYVYTNLNTYGVSYYLPGNSLSWEVTESTINADFLRAVFPAADEDITRLLAEMNLNPSRTYKITINSTGYLQITHEGPASYEIKWVMDNGDLIETTSVKEGLVPTQADPAKTGIAGYTYTFDGWYPEVKAAIEDAVYVATFKETKDASGEYNTFKDVPSDNAVDSVTFDTAKFSNANIKAPNADIKYFANATTWKAYRMPSAHGNAGNLNADMLKDVFGITTSYPNEYNYTYAAGKLSVYRNCELTAAKDHAVTAQIVDGEFKYMADSQGNNLKDDVDAYVSGGGSFDKLKYTYTSDGVLTLTQEMTVADTKYTSVNIGDSLITYSTAINTLFGTLGAQYNTTNATFVDYNTIVSVIYDFDFTNLTADEVAAAAAIKSLLDSAQLTGKADTGSMSDVKFSLVSLTGDNAIKISYTGTTQATKPFPDATASTSAKYKYTAVAEEKNVSGGFMAGIVPKYVYNSLDTYGLSYYLPSYRLEWAVTKSTINADFLRAVFPSADEDIAKLLAEMDLNPDKVYKITITSSGYLQITHEEPIPEYEIKWVMDNGDLIETTSVKEGLVPTQADPAKTGIAGYTYTFDGWYPEVKAATEDAVYVATFKETTDTGEGYKTVKNLPADSTTDAVTFDTAKFSNANIKAPNADIKYFANATTWKAYRIPSAHGNAGNLNADMLKDVFGITAAYSDDFDYTYAAGKLSIYRNCGLTITENQAVTAQIVDSEFEFMADSQGNNLKDAVDAYVSGGGSLDELKYSYTSDGIVTLTQTKIVNDTLTTYTGAGDSLSTYSTAISTLFGKLGAQYNVATATFVDYNTIVSVINDSNFTNITPDEVAAAAAIKSLLDSAQLTGKADTGSMSDVKFSLISLTGDNGITIKYTGTKQETKPFPDKGSSPITGYRSAAVEEKSVSGGFIAGIVPRYVYNNSNTYGLSYYLSNYSLEWAVTKNSICADFLRTVFPAADEDITKLLAEMDLNLNRAYKITINSSGYLQITHEEPIPSYEIKWVMDNGDPIATTSVKEGSLPKYTGATPVKEADSQYTYTFDGWTPEITAATGDTEYKAVFTAKENTYSIVSQGTTSQSLTWKKGSGLELTITAKQDGDIDRSFEDFTGVKMNGSLLERDKDYKASKGSTIITVSPDALEQLPVGENTLTVQFAYGEVSVQINVLEADKPVIDSPRTGDPVSPFALMSMIAISAAAIAILIVMKRRKKAQ